MIASEIKPLRCRHLRQIRTKEFATPRLLGGHRRTFYQSKIADAWVAAEIRDTVSMKRQDLIEREKTWLFGATC